MKMPLKQFQALRRAINAIGGLMPEATMRERWDKLWDTGFDVNPLYREGLNDDHIDTALRRIAAGKFYI